MAAHLQTLFTLLVVVAFASTRNNLFFIYLQEDEQNPKVYRPMNKKGQVILNIILCDYRHCVL